MRIRIDGRGILSVAERCVTRNGTSYEQETDVGIIREPYESTTHRHGWLVYFYIGAHHGGEFDVTSKDEAISKLLRAYLYPTERLF